jgi:hypothetical protein
VACGFLISVMSAGCEWGSQVLPTFRKQQHGPCWQAFRLPTAHRLPSRHRRGQRPLRQQHGGGGHRGQQLAGGPLLAGGGARGEEAQLSKLQGEPMCPRSGCHSMQPAACRMKCRPFPQSNTALLRSSYNPITTAHQRQRALRQHALPQLGRELLEHLRLAAVAWRGARQAAAAECASSASIRRRQASMEPRVRALDASVPARSLARPPPRQQAPCSLCGGAQLVEK